MKRVLIYITFLFITTGSYSQVFYNETKADADLYSQKERMTRERIRAGKIRSVKTYSYKSDTSSSAKDGYLSAEMNYDEAGNLIDYKLFRKNGGVKYHYAYQWDNAGRNLEFKQLCPDGTSKYREENTYDASGNMTATKNYGRASFLSRKEKLWYRNTARFDDRQNMLEQTYYHDSSEKKLFDRFVYSYYDDGSKKQTVEYNWKGKVRYAWNYDCNPLGKMEAKNLKDTSKICIRYETDKDGNKIKVKEENARYGKVGRIVHKFDKNENQLEEITYDTKGRLRFHSVYTYDEKDNCTSHTAYQRNSNKIRERSVFLYDTAGNLTERIAYKNSTVPDRIVKYNYSR